MAKRKRMHTVVAKGLTKKTFVGVLSMRDIEARVRKSLPPPSQLHRTKVAYTRKRKHPKHDE